MASWLLDLSDETRCRLLRVLEASELSVAELCSVLGLPQSTISRHLKHLRQGGWIAARREGTSQRYQLAVSHMSSPQRRLWRCVRDNVDPPPQIERDKAALERVLAERAVRRQAFFSGAAARWDRWRGELFGPRLDGWAVAAGLNPQAVVGDLGCGTGGLTQLLAAGSSRVIAVDSSEAMLQAAAVRLAAIENVELKSGSLQNLPLDASSLDAAWMVLVLSYCESLQRVFEEVRRVCRVGGRLHVVDLLPHNDEDFQREMGQLRLGIDRAELEALAIDAGWKPLRHRTLPVEHNSRGPELFLASWTAA
jgi:SAM-dependent methyltransferase